MDEMKRQLKKKEENVLRYEKYIKKIKEEREAYKDSVRMLEAKMVEMANANKNENFLLQQRIEEL